MMHHLTMNSLVPVVVVSRGLPVGFIFGRKVTCWKFLCFSFHPSSYRYNTTTCTFSNTSKRFKNESFWFTVILISSDRHTGFREISLAPFIIFLPFLNSPRYFTLSGSISRRNKSFADSCPGGKKMAGVYKAEQRLCKSSVFFDDYHSISLAPVISNLQFHPLTPMPSKKSEKPVNRKFS